MFVGLRGLAGSLVQMDLMLHHWLLKVSSSSSVSRTSSEKGKRKRKNLHAMVRISGEKTTMGKGKTVKEEGGGRAGAL